MRYRQLVPTLLLTVTRVWKVSIFLRKLSSGVINLEELFGTSFLGGNL